MSKVNKLAGALALIALAPACEQGRVEQVTNTDTDGITGASQTDGNDTTTTTDPLTSGGTINLDIGGLTSGGPLGCPDGTCNEIDLLFVIDNSGTMGEEQLNLARNLPRLIQQLQNLEDEDGNAIHPSVNIMVTNSDMGHPLCTPFQKADYVPRQGAPVYTGCNARIERFTGLGDMPLSVPEACTANCPSDIAPGGPFIHFDIDKTNVPNDDVAAALSCIGPQGIDGCGYEAQLESMLQALYPQACWNNPDQEHCKNDPEWSNVKNGFLRPDAVLAVVMITDEVECSVIPPEGFSYFTNDQMFWETNPTIDLPQATSAVCWNGGVVCDDDDGDGVYESCTSQDDTSVLHPVSRYTTYLHWLRDELDKEVVMLGILGVPPVTEHNPEIPHQPTEGGVFALEYRDWIDGEYDGTDAGGDILPNEWAAGVTADNKRFEFGRIGPGCTGQNADGEFTGQAIPPTRIIEVCESLNYTDDNGNEQIRCCIESICDEDFSKAIDCLTGILQTVSGPIG